VDRGGDRGDGGGPPAASGAGDEQGAGALEADRGERVPGDPEHRASVDLVGQVVRIDLGAEPTDRWCDRRTRGAQPIRDLGHGDGLEGALRGACEHGDLDLVGAAGEHATAGRQVGAVVVRGCAEVGARVRVGLAEHEPTGDLCGHHGGEGTGPLRGEDHVHADGAALGDQPQQARVGADATGGLVGVVQGGDPVDQQVDPRQVRAGEPAVVAERSGVHPGEQVGALVEGGAEPGDHAGDPLLVVPVDHCGDLRERGDHAERPAAEVQAVDLDVPLRGGG
jgi:hypothetical protein